MKILITGANGTLGKSLCRALIKHELLTPRKHELNISNIDQIYHKIGTDVDLVIHLASETDHEYCDINPSQCYFTNTIGTAFLVKYAKIKDIPIIYQSTASIFDGIKNQPYTPEDEPNPINHYNNSKYLGEILVREYRKHIIIRTGWIFGGGKTNDKKFVAKILHKINSGEKKIKVCDDCIGCPTYSQDLADAYKYVVDNLVDSGEWGTYNAVNKYDDDGVSRYQFATEIVRILGVDVEIIPCKIDDLKDEFPCKRTNYEVLEPGIGMPHWAKSLRGYLLAYDKY